MIGQAGQRTQTPSATSFQPTKWNASFGIMFNFWWSAGLVDGLKPHLSPLSSQKNEMLVFALCSTSDDQLGWSMDSNPICHPFQAKKMKYSFLYCIQLLMIGLVIGLEHHPPALSSQKNEMLIFGFYLTSDDQPRWSTDSNPICHLSPGIKWNSHFCITFNLWWSSGLVMDSNPICHPSPAKKMKCQFLDYVQLLMIGRAGPWTRTPSATFLQPKKWNACFWIMFNFWWLAMLVDGLKPHLLPLSSQKMKCLFLDYFQFWVISQAGRWTQTPSTTPLQPNNAMLIFGLRSTSYDWPGWSMDSNPICNPSPTKKMKCSFLDYVQLLMIGQAGQRTPTPPATSFQPKNEMLIFVLRYSSDDQPGWSMDSKLIHHPSSQKNEMLIFVLRSTSDDWRGWLMDSKCIHYPSPAKKLKCSFLYYI